jgi:hypothetical protein
MTRLLTRRLVLGIVAVLSAACTPLDQRLQQHQEKLASLAASAVAIGDAWLAGSTSVTYTSSALEQTFTLTEKERRALASTPDALADPRGAELSQAAERFSRVLANLRHDVRTADTASFRRHLSLVAGLTTERR